VPIAPVRLGIAQMRSAVDFDGDPRLVAQEIDLHTPAAVALPQRIGRKRHVTGSSGDGARGYGRRMYEVMRYWDDDHPEWDAEGQAFAPAWRNLPKWVVSRSLKSVGPNTRLVEDDLEGAMRELKAERDGEIEVAGKALTQSLTKLGLIDEYRIYLHPVVLGHGKPYFAGPRLRLRPAPSRSTLWLMIGLARM
jgi:dihydrofolate reductase